MNLEERVAHLERSNRWLRRLCIAAVALLASSVLMAQDARGPRTVEAEKFVLTGRDGKTRAVLESDTDCSRLTLFDDEGVKRVVLGTGPGGASALHLFSQTRVRAGLGVGGDNGPADLALADKGGLRAQLYVEGDGNPGLVLRDPGEVIRAKFELRDQPTIEFTGKEGKVTWRAPPE